MVKAQIMVVEDEGLVAIEIKETLEKMGYYVPHVVSNGKDAVSLASTEKPDLVLMDIRLNGPMDGIEAARQIRENLFIPVIFLTAHSDEETLRRAKTAESYGYLLKPFDDRALIAAIEMALYKSNEELIRSKESLEELNTELEGKVKDRTIALEQALSQLEKANQELHKLSYLDGLTGIRNRRYFDEKLVQWWELSVIEHKPLCLLMLDLDHFKKVNDYFGHTIGDEALIVTTRTINGTLRKANDIFARLGGEEFGVLISDITLEDSKIVAENIRSKVESIRFKNNEIRLTISIGLCHLIPNKDLSSEDLYKAADIALYNAKQKGRNQVSLARV